MDHQEQNRNAFDQPTLPFEPDPQVKSGRAALSMDSDYEIEEGRKLRDEGMEIAQAAQNRADDGEWEARAWRSLGYLCSLDADFTAQTLRVHAGSPRRPNAMGALFNQARRSGMLSVVRYEQSSRKERHASMVRVYRGK